MSWSSGFPSGGNVFSASVAVVLVQQAAAETSEGPPGLQEVRTCLLHWVGGQVQLSLYDELEIASNVTKGKRPKEP